MSGPVVPNQVTTGILGIAGTLLALLLAHISKLPIKIIFGNKEVEKQEMPERINGTPCGFHHGLVAEISQCTAAVRNLDANSDRHHREQREDIGKLYDAVNNQAQILARHGVKIEVLEKR
jgi:hypothetical protein